MRAIGAQRSLIMAMVLVEAVVLGVVFGGLGVLLGSGIMAILHTKGIPAPNDIAYFFFAGPRLLPTVSSSNLAIAMGLVIFVTVISTLIPAWMATRVSPLRAMQVDE